MFKVLHIIEVPTLSAGTTDPDHDQLDSLVVSFIYSMIRERLESMILDPEATPSSLWKCLETIFHDNKANKIIQVNNKLCTLELGTQSVADVLLLIGNVAP